MRNTFLRLFTWWNGATLGTLYHIWRKAEFVGEDQFGNRYYKEKKSGKRHVTYNGYADPSAIPPGWHGWMHYRSDVAPTDEKYQAKDWESEHQPNLTGTAFAYHPKGSISSANSSRPAVTGDYEAWSPE